MERIIGVGMDYSPSSKAAVKWILENLARNGDQIILIHVSSKSGATQKDLWEGSGSPLIPLEEFVTLNLQAQYGIIPDKEILDFLTAASRNKQFKVLAKVYWGDAREKLTDAVGDLKLDSLVLGCRGLGPLKRAVLGSVSNYVVNNASCPVTVVRSAA